MGRIGLEKNPQGKISLTAVPYSKENNNLCVLSIVGRTVKTSGSETLEQVSWKKVAGELREQTR